MRRRPLLASLLASALPLGCRRPAPQKPLPAEAPPPSASALTPARFPRASVSSDVAPITREQLAPKPPRQVFFPELRFALDALRLLDRSAWRGEGPMPLSLDQFDQEKLELYAEKNDERARRLQIPPEAQTLYLPRKAAAELDPLLRSSYRLFLALLKAQGVHAAYLAELSQRALPNAPDRVRYVNDDGPSAPPTAVQLWSGSPTPDFSLLELRVYPADVHQLAADLSSAALLGSPPPADAAHQERDMALRFLAFHELTHALQRTAEALLAPSEARASPDIWRQSSRAPWQVDTRYHRSWGPEPIRSRENRDLSKESQAEGVAFQLTSDVYRLSDAQRRQLWEHRFERLREARAHWEAIVDLLERRFPSFDASSLGARLESDVVAPAPPGHPKRKALQAMCGRLREPGALGGYLHPMRPDELGALWEFFRKV